MAAWQATEPALEPAGRDGPHVVVVGGGLAGAAAAHRLAVHGARVTLLERDERLGGRARHATRDGRVYDVGAHLLGGRDAAVRRLAEEAGLGARLLPVRPAALAWVRAGEVRHGDAVGWRGIGRLPGVSTRSMLRLVRLGRWMARFEDLLDPARPEAAARLDDRSLADFVTLYFGRSALEGWAAPFVADLGAEPETASRALFALHLAARRLASVGTLRDGVGLLPDALARAADDVRTGAAVREVGGRPDAPEVVVDGAPEGEARLAADAVVVATPAATAARLAAPLLLPAEREALAAGTTAGAAVLAVGLERVVVGRCTRIRVPRREGWPLDVVHVEPGGARAPQGAELAVMVADPAALRARRGVGDDVHAKELLGLLQRLAPGASGAAGFTALHRVPDAWPRFDVGRVRAVARLRRLGAARRAEGRRLYLAGDHLVAPTLEGAAVSGLRAADEAAEDLGLAPV
ncbi:MAG: FAD-dependent oxidoreductase [Myxococcota bacterium]|nr:FAD-dependent oxidoreductase [Myxococcota bacterium]